MVLHPFLSAPLSLISFLSTRHSLDRCSQFPSLDPPSMPTPSANGPQPTALPEIAEPISTRTCPPEVDRIAAWRESPDSTSSGSNSLDYAPSPVVCPNVLGLAQPRNGSVPLATKPLKAKKIARAVEDAAPGRSSSSSSPAETSCAPSQPPTVPANSSLFNYEFSNVRVGTNPAAPGSRHSVDR